MNHDLRADILPLRLATTLWLLSRALGRLCCALQGSGLHGCIQVCRIGHNNSEILTTARVALVVSASGLYFSVTRGSLVRIQSRATHFCHWGHLFHFAAVCQVLDHHGPSSKTIATVYFAAPISCYWAVHGEAFSRMLVSFTYETSTRNERETDFRETLVNDKVWENNMIYVYGVPPRGMHFPAHSSFRTTTSTMPWLEPRTRQDRVRQSCPT